MKQKKFSWQPFRKYFRLILSFSKISFYHNRKKLGYKIKELNVLVDSKVTKQCEILGKLQN